MNHAFTAAEIARALGCSKQNVHIRLSGVRPAGELPVHGNVHNVAKTWRIESLPATMLLRLSTVAANKGYPTVTALLSQPFERYKPAIPLAQIAPQALAKARKLQQAMAEILPLHDDRSISRGDLAQRGLAAYERAFGHKISGRHWRTLFKRVIERDNGAQNWTRLELYLEENPPRISRRDAAAIAHERRLDMLEDALSNIADAVQLDAQQRVYIWTKACDELHFSTEAGRNITKVKKAIIKALQATDRFGRDPESIRRSLNRHWTTYLKNGRRLNDGRSARDQRRKLPEHDSDVLKARIIDCGGRVSQAFREVRDEGALGSETLDRTIANPRNKSYVPNSIRAEVTPGIKMLLHRHRGKREFLLNSAHNTRDYSGFFAGDSYQADDCTAPVYYWEQGDDGRIHILRGQLILLIDERSLLALGFALHSERNYNARVIRNLITRVHDDYGLPRVRFYFERGLWKRAKILTGASAYDVPFEETELGLREFNIQFVHAKYPRGKVIERVLGLIQNEMERLPGYVGRDEKLERFENVQRKIRESRAGQYHPSEFLMHKDQWLTVLNSLMEKYNRERQNGRVLNGISPLEAWKRFQSSEGQVRLGSHARVILAEHRLKMRVQRNGITLRQSLGGGTYCDEATGRLLGRDVLVWVNPEDQSAIGITSLDRREGPWVVARLDPLPALNPTPEQYAQSEAQIAAHNRYVETAYRTISPHLAVHNFRRTTFVDRTTSNIARSLDEQKDEFRQERTKTDRLLRKARTAVRERGLNINVSTTNAERAAAAADLVKRAYARPSK